KIVARKPVFLLWRAWHVPDDRDRDRTFIAVMNDVWGVTTYPSPEMHLPYDNKIFQYAMATKCDWSIPDTKIIFSFESAINYARTCDLPIVVKASEGACSQNVKIISSRRNLIELVEIIFSKKGLPLYFPGTQMRSYIIVQQYLPIQYSWRIVCVGNKIALSGTLYAHSERTNLSPDQQWRSLEKSPANIEKLALDITHALQWPWIALDLVEWEGKPYLLEFSSGFGFSAVNFFKQETGSPNAWIIKKMMD